MLRSLSYRDVQGAGTGERVARDTVGTGGDGSILHGRETWLVGFRGDVQFGRRLEDHPPPASRTRRAPSRSRFPRGPSRRNIRCPRCAGVLLHRHDGGLRLEIGQVGGQARDIRLPRIASDAFACAGVREAQALDAATMKLVSWQSARRSWSNRRPRAERRAW